ncbi:MAG: amidohydrolase [Chloroflexota bacterium]
MTTKTPITPAEIMARASAIQDKIVGWRRTIHKQPELSYTEVKTARLVHAVLQDLGVEAETGVAKTGVVGRIEAAGPTVGLRADMDALPILEENGTEYDSERPGIMHACGHDCHTAMLLGAATVLKGFADEGRLPGSIRLLFQPSEEARDDENLSGGERMVQEGVMGGIDSVFGLHVNPRLLAGQVTTRAGGMMAGGDIVKVTIRGTGGHAAAPHVTNDPLILAAHFLLAAQNIVSRRLNPIDAGVVSLTTIHGGTAGNVIPETVEMTGTMRSFSLEVRKFLQNELRRAAGVVEALGGEAEVTIIEYYPPTVNDDAATDVAFDALKGLLGEDQVSETPPIMAGEDFSYMLQKAPGCYIGLGVQGADWGRPYHVHTPTFRVDESALPIGTASLVAMAVEWMQRNQ